MCSMFQTEDWVKFKGKTFVEFHGNTTCLWIWDEDAGIYEAVRQPAYVQELIEIIEKQHVAAEVCEIHVLHYNCRPTTRPYYLSI